MLCAPLRGHSLAPSAEQRRRVFLARCVCLMRCVAWLRMSLACSQTSLEHQNYMATSRLKLGQTVTVALRCAEGRKDGTALTLALAGPAPAIPFDCRAVCINSSSAFIPAGKDGVCDESARYAGRWFKQCACGACLCSSHVALAPGLALAAWCRAAIQARLHHDAVCSLCPRCTPGQRLSA